MKPSAQRLEASIFAMQCARTGAPQRDMARALIRARDQREVVQALMGALARRARFRRYAKDLISFAKFCRKAGCDATAKHLTELARLDRMQAYWASVEARAHVEALRGDR